MNDRKINHTNVLTCCLKLTRNLERRIIVRRLACTSYFKKETNNEPQTKQVTIASYCRETFDAVIEFLRTIYDDMDLVSKKK